MIALNKLFVEWVRECPNEQEAYVVCALFLDGCMIDRVLCASGVLGMTVSDPQSWTKTIIKAVSLRPIYCHSFMATSTQIKCFLLSFLPPLEPSRGKSVKLEVEEDKSAKGSNPTPTPTPGSGNWFVSLHLTPRVAFPCSRRRKHRRGGCASGRIVALQSTRLLQN